MKVTYAERMATYKVALRKNGLETQLVKAIEEMSELTKEICKIKCGQGSHAALADEIADVTIMLEQLKLFFDIRDLVDDHVDMKIHRLQERIGMVKIPDGSWEIEKKQRF